MRDKALTDLLTKLNIFLADVGSADFEEPMYFRQG